MFYVAWNLYGENHGKLYFPSDMEEYFADTFNPEIEYLARIPFKVTGKTYQEKKQSVQSTALEWSNSIHHGILSWSDLAEIGDWFYKQGRRYGLLHEFQENGIC